MSIASSVKAACLVAGAALAGAAAAQEKSDDQVGLVFPAFFTVDEMTGDAAGQSIAFALKLTVQANLSSEDPTTSGQERPERGFGRGITYYVPATMAEPGHDAAERLARINGLQGTVWGLTTQLIDGIAIQPFLTLAPPYEDYRETQQEVWRVNVEGVPFTLGPPQQRIAFLPETVPAEFVQRFGNPSEIDYCLRDGTCRTFPDAQVTRALSVSDDGEAVIRRGGVDYTVTLPTSDIYTSEVVDYANLYIAYARGNLNQAIALADLYLERHGPSGTALDARLYKAAALARTGRTEEADGEIRAALTLNPVARRALRFGIMVELARKGAPTDQSDALFRVLEANYELTEEFEQAYRALR